MYRCDGPEIENITNRAECEANPQNEWINARFHFDNLPQALLTLFVVSTLDGWMGVTHDVIDAVDIDIQPQKAYAEWRAIFFVSFIILMAFLVMNMIIGVLVDNYYEVNERMKLKAIERKTHVAEIKRRKKQTKKFERSKGNTVKKIARKAKKKHKKHVGYLRNFYDNWLGEKDFLRNHNYGPRSLKMRFYITHKYFDLVLAGVIVLNILVMATEHYDMSPEWELIHRVANYIFTVIFIIEAGLKIYAFTLTGYFQNSWNIADFFIVIVSIIGIIVSELSITNKSMGSNAGLLRILRMTRILRVIKLLKPAKGFMILMNTLISALPQVGNLAVILGLQLFIFSAVGVQLFGRIECTPQNPCDGLSNDHAHFKNFWMSLLTLFRVSTGDNWSGIMKVSNDTDTLKANCDSSAGCKKNCCVNIFLSVIYFIIHVLMTQLILMNIVVAVLMKGFEDATQINSEEAELIEATKVFVEDSQRSSRTGISKMVSGDDEEEPLTEKPDLDMIEEEDGDSSGSSSDKNSDFDIYNIPGVSGHRKHQERTSSSTNSPQNSSEQEGKSTKMW